MTLIPKMSRFCKETEKVQHTYEKNQHIVRYKFLDNAARSELCSFYLGLKVLKKLDFKLGDHLVLTKRDDKIFIIEKNIYGNPLRVLSKTINANYLQLQIPPKAVKYYNLVKTKDILVLEYKIHINKTNPDLNYIEVKF
jgi:hypothetical protein